MKRLLTLFAAISMLFVAGCGGDDYDDTAIRNEITDLANRVAKLEQLCQQMNTNISSLQTIVNALQQNDFITAVVPVTQGGKVIGYTITFSRSGAITIYHGTNGADGKDGKDGSTPQVSVKQDTDGIYYWTLNGEWLTDEAGNKIQAEGKDGADGSNGNDGADGITPQLKIEENYWYISYDGGATWTQLGKAVGEDGADGSDGSDGKDGMDGEDGDSIFSGVSQDDEFVYFHLSDGTMITLPKHDKENIQFEDLNVKVICCKNWDTNNDGELSYDEAAAVTDIGYTFSNNKEIIAYNELKYFTGLSSVYFGNCEKLWKIALPEGITTIPRQAFYACYTLSKINIPNSVTTIGADAFRYTTCLEKVVLGENVNSIDSSAFSTSLGNNSFRPLTVYIKAQTPPKVIYTQTTNTPASFYAPSNSKAPILTIYVPEDAYETYTSYTNGKVNTLCVENWYYIAIQTKCEILPYDFEEDPHNIN